MIERNETEVRVCHDSGRWQALHSAEAFGGPVEILLDGQPILRDCRTYIDDLTDESAVLRRLRDFRKGGAAVVASEGYLPFGNEVSYTQTCRYAANHVRMTLDVHWPKGMAVKRHLGVGGLFLPGKWARLYCLPPASHLAMGQTPQWHTLPPAGEKPVMVGHWHRPPLALVFERHDGTAVEIGTGSDIWRWEQCLGHGPESGSYKLMLSSEGIQVVREPLMCCEDFQPACRDYRFSWYVAWKAPDFPSRATPVPREMDITLDNAAAVLAGGQDIPALCVDADKQPWPAAARRAASDLHYVRGEHADSVCWESPALQKRVRRLIRQIAACPEAIPLVWRNLQPAPCWDPVHLNRRKAEGIAHWDMAAILDFAVWTRKQLGEQWPIWAELSGPLAELPSMQGLFSANGFEGEVFLADD